MTEDLLHFIWKNRYFNQRGLELESGEALSILNAGEYNTNQGPDFLHAMIRIADLVLAGHIEMHVLASDWFRHGHALDNNYNSVILHVVWLDDCADQPVPLPTLVIQHRVSALLLDTYRNWMQHTDFIPCESHFCRVDPLILNKWKSNLLYNRLAKKAKQIEQELLCSVQHWEDVLWHMLAAGFGLQVNAQAFEAVARSIPLRIIQKHRNSRFQLEALLFGQAGLLNESKDEYQLSLKKEHDFLRQKYSLQPIAASVLFLRMRPANFPTIRLAQLAAFLQKKDQLFQFLKETEQINSLFKLLELDSSSYWQNHLVFGQESSQRAGQTGMQLAQQIIINVFIPFVFGYGQIYSAEGYMQKAMAWLAAMPAEKNNIVSSWMKMGAAVNNAADSQALLECKKNYCNEKKCLDCGIGQALLGRPPKNERGNRAASPQDFLLSKKL